MLLSWVTQGTSASFISIDIDMCMCVSIYIYIYTHREKSAQLAGAVEYTDCMSAER